ncbi:MAG: HEPN domain-containing protein [Nitrospira sp.]|nr:HEPN domain-containing protein [Nitrospira sp.]
MALKDMLRAVGIEPPKLHVVGRLLRDLRDRFPEDVRSVLDDLAHISKRLRKEWELAFYGDIDFIPTEEYTVQEASQAYRGAELVLQTARQVVNAGR